MSAGHLFGKPEYSPSFFLSSYMKGYASDVGNLLGEGGGVMMLAILAYCYSLHLALPKY